MFRLLRPFIFASFLLSAPFAWAQNATVLSTHGNWTAYTFTENGDKVCYISSAPITDEGEYTQRGDIAALVTHWPAQNSKNVFSYVAGYEYKKDSEVSITIGSQTFTLFTQGEMAWAADESTDKRLSDALKKGSKMVVKGTSSRGTLTTDTYSLSGSTAAFNAINKACGVK